MWKKFNSFIHLYPNLPLPVATFLGFFLRVCPGAVNYNIHLYSTRFQCNFNIVPVWTQHRLQKCASLTAMLLFHSCFCTRNINVRGLLLSVVTVSLHYLPTWSATAFNSCMWQNAFYRNLKWILKISSNVIVTQQRPIVEQSSLEFRK